jgi:hypothetical protein
VPIALIPLNPPLPIPLDTPGDRRTIWLRPTITFFLSVLIVGSCYLFSGNALNLIFGSVLLAVFIVIPPSASAGQMPGALLIGLSAVLGIALGWLAPVFAGVISARQWYQCGLVMGTLLVPISAVAYLVAILTRSRPAGIAIVTVTTLAWLSFPIWLAVPLTGSQLNWSTRLHPLFAINHVLNSLGIWTEQQRAYSLTTFGQDVQYQMPRSIWPVVLFQCGITIGAWLICFACSRIAPRSINQIDTDASIVNTR